MKQSRFMSIFETLGGTALGFVMALGIQYVICWWFGLPLSTSDNLGIISIFTVASLVRGYFWRRICEALHIRLPLSAFVQAVVAECYRQREVEGWTVEHDDQHQVGDLAMAGAAYAKQAHIHLDGIGFGNNPRALLPNFWPWSHDWWKPTGFRRDLVKACALIIAEGDKFDRSRKQKRRSF